MHRPSTLMSVMRHEGWHAAQDCMAGTIDNNMIAIIMDEEKVPQLWQDIASKTTLQHLLQSHGRKKRSGQVKLKV